MLVADDDLHILELVRLALDHEGYAVLTASDGDEALRLAIEHRPDLCVLDVMMPGMSGFEVSRRLAEEKGMADVPVLFLTAQERDDVAAAGFAVDAGHYLQKPFSPSALRARVRAVLEAWEA